MHGGFFIPALAEVMSCPICGFNLDRQQKKFVNLSNKILTIIKATRKLRLPSNSKLSNGKRAG